METERAESIELKGLSLWQPWASLMALGTEGKTIETRSWATSYRGWVAIHASASFSDKNMQLASKPPFRAALVRGGYANVGSLPLGCFVCIVNLQRVESTNRLDPQSIPEREQWYGDFSPDRYAWFTDTPVLIKKEIPYKATQRLFDIDDETSKAILKSIGVTLPSIKRGALVFSCPKCGKVIDALSEQIAKFIQSYGCADCRDKEADIVFAEAGVSYA